MLSFVIENCPFVIAMRAVITARVECDLGLIVSTYPAYERGMD